MLLRDLSEFLTALSYTARVALMLLYIYIVTDRGERVQTSYVSPHVFNSASYTLQHLLFIGF